MLTIFTGSKNRDCQGHSRRDFLKIGTLGLAGLSLPELLAYRARAAEEKKYVSDKSVVFLFLNGGPSQIETFDPKPAAPVENRSINGEVQTKIPGVTIGGSFPKLAALADKLAIVRSFVPANGNHDGGAKLFSAGHPLKVSMGSMYSRLAGTGHPLTGMPSNVFLTPQSLGQPASQSPFNYGGVIATGPLPSTYAAFHPTAPTEPMAGGRNAPRPGTNATGLLADMQLRLSQQQLEERRGLLKQLESLQRGLDGGQLDDLDKYQKQAYEVLVNGVSQAFDLTKEDPKTLAKYDTRHMKTPEDLAKRLVQTRSHSPEQLGRQMLLARRLCEAGCGYVTVGITGWDMHGNNGFGIEDGFKVLGPAVDHALSAFIEDLHERGLSEKIMLVVAGEIGRTPKIVSRAAGMDKSLTRVGRDHWANLGALLLAGGGLKMGQVVGASDKIGGSPATRPVTLQNLLATVMYSLFDVGELRIKQGLPVDLVRLITESQPIQELVG